MRMDLKPLSTRELKVLTRIDRRLTRGPLRSTLFGLCVGILGGLGWAAVMLSVFPGSNHWHLTAPTGNGTHPMLDEVFYWLALHFGPVVALCLLAGGGFGAIGLVASIVSWPSMQTTHAKLAPRAMAHAQFTPQYTRQKPLGA